VVRIGGIAHRLDPVLPIASTQGPHPDGGHHVLVAIQLPGHSLGLKGKKAKQKKGKLNLYTDSLRFFFFVAVVIFIYFIFHFLWWLMVVLVVIAGGTCKGPPHGVCGNFIRFYEGFSAFLALRSTLSQLLSGGRL